MGFLSSLFNRFGFTSTTALRPFRIENPIIGFLNLQGETGNAILEQDQLILASLFTVSRTSIDVVPKCQVLFIYCAFDGLGKIIGTEATIRQLIKEAGAYVAVIASENDPDSYVKAVGKRTDWSANITLAIDRKADKLALFFRQLFEAMYKGQSMPMAWVEINPQIPGRVNPDEPSLMMLADVGHIVFTQTG